MSIFGLPRWAPGVCFAAGLALPALAQQTPPAEAAHAATSRVSDSTTPVPALSYRSVFADLPQGVESGSGDWRATNEAVGQFKRGHIDLLQLEKAPAAKPKDQP